MDIRLNQIEENTFNIKKFKNIIYLTLKLILAISIILIIVFTKENKGLSLVIAILIYINLIMITKFFANSFKTTVLWKFLEESISSLEIKDKNKENVCPDINAVKGVMGDSYEEIIDDIEGVLKGVNKAIENSKVNERMNLELVSNLNSKLDKPLDSIIENISIIKEYFEESRLILEDNDKKCNAYLKAQEQSLNILYKKSNNLKKLIDELFEASKLASGDIKLELEEIEILSLLRQALIEFKDEIDKSNVNFKVNMPKEKIFIKCNGEKIWRVFQILIENCLKHSPGNSRVYIEVIKNGNIVDISFKNTSKDELNIPANQLVEIINTKNDEEVSGLNLEIARNLILLQDGKFSLDIEADLFKVYISFSVEEEKGEEDNDR